MPPTSVPKARGIRSLEGRTFESRPTWTAAGSSTAPAAMVLMMVERNAPAAMNMRTRRAFAAFADLAQAVSDPLNDAGIFQAARDDEQADNRDDCRTAETVDRLIRGDDPRKGKREQDKNSNNVGAQSIREDEHQRGEGDNDENNFVGGECHKARISADDVRQYKTLRECLQLMILKLNWAKCHEGHREPFSRNVDCV